MKTEIIMNSEKLKGTSFVFTGFRSQELEDYIKQNGGEIKSGISNKVTYLVCKDKNSGSSKLKKATDLGIKLLSQEDVYKL
jgi:DNA ligase (NAD+)